MSTMNSQGIDLDLYRERIAYTGRLEPSLQTLADLIEHHVAAIPFENIDVLLDRGIDISPQAVDAKLLARRRGGYCYEQNGLFQRVLATIGFEVEALAARVMWMAPENAPPLPRTHMALRVTLDGEPWLADVGFGGGVPTSPLRMTQTDPQPTAHTPFRVVPHGAGAVVQTLLDGVWRPLYALSMEPMLAVDYQPLNWFTSTHPGSVFRKNLMAARATRDARHTLLNARLTVRYTDGSTERRTLNADELEAVLVDSFGLVAEPAWRPLLERVAAASAEG